MRPLQIEVTISSVEPLVTTPVRRQQRGNLGASFQSWSQFPSGQALELAAAGSVPELMHRSVYFSAGRFPSMPRAGFASPV